MALSPIQRVTIQASLLNITSTILAQVLKRYKQIGSLSFSNIEVLPILHFLFWCLASTPPNFLWQEFLENSFPGYPSAAQNSEKVKIKVDDDGKVSPLYLFFSGRV